MAVWLWRDADQLESEGPTAETIPSVELSATLRQPAAVTVTLPSLDAPLAKTIVELEQLAHSGHARAACRLAAELERCASVPVLRQDHDRWLAQRRRALALVSRDGTPEEIQQFGKVFERQLRRREKVVYGAIAHCRGVQPVSALERIQHWRRAALLGDATAIRQYGSGRVFNWGDILDTSAALPAYRAEAEDMMTSLARSGDLEATLLLAAAYSPLSVQWPSLLSQVVEHDGARSLALYRRALSAVRDIDSHQARKLESDISHQIDQLENNLSPQDLHRAVPLQIQLRGQWIDIGAPSLRRPISVLGSVIAAPPAACR